MNLWDLGNTLFEGVGAVVVWQNVRAIRRDQVVRGMDWRVSAFFTSWGVWNLAYYPALGQYFSAAAGAALCVGNLVWVWHAIKYRNNVPEVMILDPVLDEELMMYVGSGELH